MQHSKATGGEMAFVVPVTVNIVVWPQLHGYVANPDGARVAAVEALEDAARGVGYLRVREPRAGRRVTRDPDMDMIK